MFIDWASHLTLLEHNPEAHILKEFALPVKKILVSQVATFLQDHKISVKVLSSPSHVSWAMETVGEGFNLPIEEEDSIAKAISLYKTWALEKNQRPSAINDNLQFFMQRILEHLSLLFQPRANTKEGIEKHAAFCSTVLDIYVEIGRKIGQSLSVETWELFLKLLIGLTDLILRPDFPNTQEQLQRKLCSQLLRVLFELWLLSRTRNPELWKALKDRVRGWTHHMALIQTWKFICIALTKRSAAILYGPSEGTESVIISTDHDSIQKINLEDEYVFYSWHRMLNLIGNPNETIAVPFIFLDFMTGVEILVNQYLKIGFSKGQDNTRYIAPTGNTIMHIFGTWLFDAIHLNRQGFEEGTALATKTLTTTISQKQNTEFLPVYSSSFFSSMRHALEQDGRVLITAIVSSTTLFTLELKGIRCLVPAYVHAIQRICTGKAKLENTVMPAENVRRACLAILGTIISFANHFGTTKFYLTANSNAIPAENFLSLHEHFSAILLAALDKETFQPNIETILSLIFAWQFETIKNGSKEFTKKSLKAILHKIKSKIWIPSVIQRSICSLSEMSIHYKALGSKGFVVANSLVDILCRMIVSIGNPCPSPQDEISALAYHCITKWITTEDQWILQQIETRNAILSVIVAGLTGKNDTSSTIESDVPTKGRRNKDKKKEEKTVDKLLTASGFEPSEIIKKAAKYTLNVLMNLTGNFPAKSGAASFSSLATEEDVMRQMIANNSDITIENSVEYMRYFMTDDNVILCVIDRKNFDPTGKPSVCIIIRDSFGRYTWDTTLSFLPLIEKPVEPTEDEILSDSPAMLQPLEDNVKVVCTPYDRATKQLESSDLSNVMEFLGKGGKGTSGAIVTVQDQVTREGDLLNNRKFNLDVDIRVHNPKATEMEDECRIKQSRMFLSHLGFLSLENRDKLYPLAHTSQLLSLIQQLDQQAERTCIRIGVLYVQKDQPEAQWYGNERGNMDYQQFIATLGWGVDVTRHTGFTGTLDTSGNITGKFAPYWSNFDTELIFQTCTLMPNNGTYPDHSHKRKQATNGSSIVVWVEDLPNFQPALVWKRLRHNALLITITPLESGLFLIRLFSKSNDIIFGPLVDGMVLRKEVIAPLVRATAVHAWNVYENPGNILPCQPRLDTIQKIYNSCKIVDCLEDFYVSLFSDLPPDSPGPISKKTSMRSPRRKTAKNSRDPRFASLRGDAASSTEQDTYSESADESKKERRRKKEKKKRFKSLQT